MKEKIVKFLTSEGVKYQIAVGIGALIAGLMQRPHLIEKILSFIGLNENEEKMNEFDYKKYLKNNPLLEKMTDEEREDKLQQAIRGGGKEEPLRKLAALGKEYDFGPEHGAVEDEYGDDAAMDDEYEKTLDPDYDKADEDEDAYERRLGLEEDIKDEILKNIKKAHDKGEKSPFDPAEPAQVTKEKGIAEQLNPEVTKTVNNLIKAMAKKYGYEEKDAVFAIQAALKQREFDNK
jgi:hypothetical protein